MPQHSNTYIINNMARKILIYILVIAVAVTSIGLVWYYFKNQDKAGVVQTDYSILPSLPLEV